MRVNWTDSSIVNGLKLTASVKRTHSLSSTWTNSRTSVTKTRTHDNSTEGTRTVTWATPTVTTTSGTTTVTMNKTITLDHKTTAKTMKATDDEAVTRSANVTTESAAPLVVAVTRSGSSATTVELQSKTITSGTIVATDTTEGSSGTVTKLSFANVKYDLTSTNSDKCVPVSGTISGAVYESGVTEAVRKFVITFGDTTVDSKISIANNGETAEEYSYSYNGCDLAREM